MQYQPLVNLSDQRVLGVEALARWGHPDVGNIPPSELHFDRRRDRADPQLGGWVLGEACREARSLAARPRRRKAVYVEA